jgi:hypothetical protein
MYMREQTNRNKVRQSIQETFKAFLRHQNDPKAQVKAVAEALRKVHGTGKGQRSK